MPHTKGDTVQMAIRGDLQGWGVREGSGNRKGNAFAAPSCSALSGLLQLPPILFHTPTALFPDLSHALPRPSWPQTLSTAALFQQARAPHHPPALSLSDLRPLSNVDAAAAAPLGTALGMKGKNGSDKHLPSIRDAYDLSLGLCLVGLVPHTGPRPLGQGTS